MGMERRSRAKCQPMPYQLGVDDVAGVYQWPIGAVMTRKAVGQFWTDCLIVLVESIRVGGAGRGVDANSRRVRYDGRLYISYSKIAGGRVYLDGELTALALEFVTHVYGVDAESDVLHNLSLKGY